jgi:hypothetical protein
MDFRGSQQLSFYVAPSGVQAQFAVRYAITDMHVQLYQLAIYTLLPICISPQHLL